MYDIGVLVITIKLDYSKVLNTKYWYHDTFLLLVLQYYFSKVQGTSTAILLSTVPTTGKS